MIYVTIHSCYYYLMDASNLRQNQFLSPSIPACLLLFSSELCLRLTHATSPIDEKSHYIGEKNQSHE